MSLVISYPCSFKLSKYACASSAVANVLEILITSSSPLSTERTLIVTVITWSWGSVLDSNSSFLALASSSLS